MSHGNKMETYLQSFQKPPTACYNIIIAYNNISLHMTIKTTQYKQYKQQQSDKPELANMMSIWYLAAEFVLEFALDSMVKLERMYKYVIAMIQTTIIWPGLKARWYTITRRETKTTNTALRIVKLRVCTISQHWHQFSDDWCFNRPKCHCHGYCLYFKGLFLFRVQMYE